MRHLFQWRLRSKGVSPRSAGQVKDAAVTGREWPPGRELKTLRAGYGASPVRIFADGTAFYWAEPTSEGQSEVTDEHRFLADRCPIRSAEAV